MKVEEQLAIPVNSTFSKMMSRKERDHLFLSMENEVTTNSEMKGYTVGYRKPPVSGRFKPGQSGNPTGKRKSKPATTFTALFDKSLCELVEVAEENGKTSLLTRKHRSVRTRVLAAASGKLRPLRELLELRDTVEKDVPTADRPGYATVDLEELRVAGPLAEMLNCPDIVIIREPKPSDHKNDDPSKVAFAKPRKSLFKQRGSYAGAQTFQALVEYELERQLWVTTGATGERRRMSMREVIAEQLTFAFEKGKPGTLALLKKLNERRAAEADRRLRVRVPWDYQIPPPPQKTD